MRLLVMLLLSCGLAAQSLSPVLRQFVSVDAPVVALEHVRVIDGTGAAAVADQTVLLEHGRIAAIGANVIVPADAKVLDLSGDTVFPGLVGMHDHLFYPDPSGVGFLPGAPPLYHDMGFSFPRLYLASGVTTLRTTGAVMPYTDLNLKQEIDAGLMIGPSMNITGPYLNGPGGFTPNMHGLSGPADATRTVKYWQSEGVTTFKAYMQITRAELAAAVQQVHSVPGDTITGHLCSIGFKEAASLGIDDLEHGLEVDTEFDPGKPPDVCPPGALTAKTLAAIDVEGPEVQATLHDLIARHVALTSTLPVFEAMVPGRPPLRELPRLLQVLSPASRVHYLLSRVRGDERPGPAASIFKKEMQFEYDFYKDGGLLLAGLDPTGNGGVVAGFGDQREVELLVEEGLTPEQAIHVATQNGAKFLHLDNEIGTLAKGKRADLVVVKGNLAQDIHDIENVQIVFKHGVGYDSAALIRSVAGQVGLH
ncbi:MAG: amidohydrolase [Acidobacteria bacterium]|nr:MAG: amidohydrolase [Acidobacteriota bacterium]